MGKDKDFCIPSLKLSPFIERYWWKDIEAGQSLLPFVPGTGAELVFGLTNSLSCIDGYGIKPLPQVTLFSPRSTTIPLIATERVSFISVRIRTGMLHHFLPLGEIHALPAVADAEEIWPETIPRLYESLCCSTSRVEMIQLIELFLSYLLSRYHSSDPTIDALANLLYYKYEGLTVQAAADKIGYSRRQLQRICKNSFGISPKNYLSLSRFNSVVRKMLLSKETRYLDYALDAGYYDQSHFIHECELFTGESPLQFLKTATTMSHFYNTSLKGSAYFSAIM